MTRLVKTLLTAVASIFGLLILASVALLLFFDPNDYRDNIAAGVREATGRELTIDGDLSLSIFPWLAIDVGRTALGNAEGFSDQPFMRFEKASLSVRLLPLILRRETAIGTASIEGLLVNLEIAADGTTNWDDLSGTQETTQPAVPETDAAPSRMDVGNIRVSDASVTYRDLQAGSSYSITNLEVNSEGIEAERPFDLDAQFDFTATPGDLGGHIEMRGTTTLTAGAAQASIEDLKVAGEVRGLTSQALPFNFDSRAMIVDMVAKQMSPGEMNLSALGVSMSASVEPFSYAGSPRPKATLRVAEFSLRELLQALEVELPATADSAALSRLSFSADAAVGAEAITLDAMSLVLDDSTMAGSLSLPTAASAAMQFDLTVDTINLDRYMAPADAAIGDAGDGAADDIEIPVDMIRALNASGRFAIERALLSGMEFTNVELGLASSGGQLRLHPLTAELYDGGYSGDVRIDASQDVPSLSVDEKLTGVNLSELAKAMFDQDNIRGTINGRFVLAGAGQNLASIRQHLNGNMALELADGAWEGTDVWHQLRAARAMYRQEPVPEPDIPARTEFTSVSATGNVSDGIFSNDDLIIELAFLRLTGSGTVDLPAALVDYSLQARVFDNPQTMSGMTEAELADFRKTVVPVKITGPLGSPRVRPDIEAVFRQQVETAIEEQKEKLKNRLLDRFLGGEDADQNDEVQPEEQNGEDAEDLEEQLKKKLLKDLFGN